jgi:molybdenum cofactor synthesis domain-containing protein
MSRSETRIVTAAVILIGDEILSGRTQDTNLKTIADFLNPLGVEVREARVIPDVHETIVATVQAMSRTYDYVFTTGGIGPTHDDITADAVAAAFGKKIGVRPDAFAILKPWYDARGQELTEARARMARIPDDAELILNPVSAAPGFRLGNVFVMAGVPQVMRGMLQDIPHRIEGGAVVHSRTIRTRGVGEGDLAGPLRELALAQPDVSFGSYPHARLEGSRPVFSVNLVARGRDPAQVDAAADAVLAMVRGLGAEVVAAPDA